MKTTKSSTNSSDDERIPVTVNLRARGLAAIDWLAERDGIDQEEEIRRLLTDAVLARKRLIAARQIGDQKREIAQNRR